MPEPHVAALQADAIAAVMRSLLAVESASRRSDSSRLALELAVAEASLALGTGGMPEGRTAPRQDTGRGIGAGAFVGATIATHQAEPAHTPTWSGDGGERAVSAPTSEAVPPRTATYPKPVEAHVADTEQATPSGSEPVRIAGPTIATDKDAVTNDRPTGDGTNGREAGSGISGVESATPGAEEVGERWPLVLRWLEDHSKRLVRNTLNTTTGDGIRLEGTELIIGFPSTTSAFVRTQLENPRNRSTLEEAVRAVYGSQWTVRCATIEGLSPPRSADELERDADFLERAWMAGERGPDQGEHSQ